MSDMFARQIKIEAKIEIGLLDDSHLRITLREDNTLRDALRRNIVTVDVEKTIVRTQAEVGRHTNALVSHGYVYGGNMRVVDIDINAKKLTLMHVDGNDLSEYVVDMAKCTKLSCEQPFYTQDADTSDLMALS
jgi:hypothetical protein